MNNWLNRLKASINRTLEKSLFDIAELSYPKVTKIITDTVIIEGKENGFEIELEPVYPTKFQRLIYDIQPSLFKNEFHREYRGRGDVLWIDKNNKDWFVMFEIDRGKKRHSLRKLLTKPASNNVWINWSKVNILKNLKYQNRHLEKIIQSTPTLFFIRPDEKIIKLIHKKIKLNKKGEDSKKISEKLKNIQLNLFD